MSDLRLPSNYRSRDKSQYFDDRQSWNSATIWQPDVYRFADFLAAGIGAETLIDVGCGSAAKLVPLASKYAIVGIDYGQNLEFCRMQHSFGDWVEADLEQVVPECIPAMQIDRAVIVCSDVIEHLLNPLPLLSTLRTWSRRGAAIVVSTPERELTYGRPHNGPPDNVCHVREWTLREFGDLLLVSGISLSYLGLTRSNNTDSGLRTILAVAVPDHRGAS